MIITEEIAKSPPPEEQTFDSTSYTPRSPIVEESPPPPYYGSISDPTHRLQAPIQPYVEQRPAVVIYRNGKPPWKRFRQAFLLAWLIWVFCAIFVKSLTMVFRPKRQHGHGKGKGQLTYDLPPDLILSDCVKDDGWRTKPDSNFSAESPVSFRPPQHQRRHDSNSSPEISEASFDIPFTEVDLLLISRGHLSAGSFNIVTSPSQAKNAVRFRVVMKYHKTFLRHLTKVCLIGREDGRKTNSKGVGIFTPTRGPPHHVHDGDNRNDTSFETTLIFPEVEPSHVPLMIKSLEINMAQTIHRIEDLNTLVHFRSLLLNGHNSSVEVKSLNATIAEIRTTNGKITGTFNVSDSLILTTTNSAIDVDVELRNSGTSSNLTVQSTNGAIDARLRLTTSYDQGTASYVVSTKTMNGHLKVDIPTQPTDSKLILSGATTNAPANITLNQWYEGGFSLRSSEAAFVRKSNPQDPSGMQRERRMDYKTIRDGGSTVIKGETYWEGRDQETLGRATFGMVRVSTTNASLMLNV